VISPSRPALIPSIAGLLAQLLFIITLLGGLLPTIALSKLLSCGYVALGCQQEVDGFTPIVDSEVEIFQDAFDLDVRFIHPSARADWAFVPASHLFDQRQKANCPAIDQ
jgi:hypothetical protein